MTIHDAQQQLLAQLYNIYDKREAANIADWVMESITGWKKIDRVVNKTSMLSLIQEARLQQVTADLLRHRPVQYALGEAWFYGMKFFVNESVLIPRPETEELVEWIINDTRQRSNGNAISILDIGSGSGCIPISLKKHLPQAQVHSCDVSAEALEVARKNAQDLRAGIHFHQLDFLNKSLWDDLSVFDIIVSNPPYIPLDEKQEMEKHVLDYEPHLALFVAQHEPLVFYKAIADFSQNHLRNGGMAYMETHMNFAPEVAALFDDKIFSGIEVRKDLQEKNRMVKAVKKI